jgi:hypothetical protein
MFFKCIYRKCQINTQIVTLLLLLIMACFSGCGNLKSGNNAASEEDSVSMKKIEDIKFKYPTFTFVRVRYTSSDGVKAVTNATSSKWFDNPAETRSSPFPRGWRWRSGGGWSTDYPSSDNNFISRLQQSTSIQVNPDPISIELTNPELINYPFFYMCDPGYLKLNDAEIKALRNYLLNGGFLMMDDFWGDNEWENVCNEMKRVFPEYEPIELTLEHPIFNCVFVLKKKPQVLNYQYAQMGRGTGVTWERPDATEPHYMALYDEKGSMMVLMCLNTDTGDGWEREGDNEWFFHEFSESQAYPLGINIVVYALTH